MAQRVNQMILIGGALILREMRRKKQYLIVKHKKGDGWEIPKTNVRRGESSVRAVIRFAGEQGGMGARVLEEAGRNSGSIKLNNKPIPQKLIYYLMLQRSVGGEIVGFDDFIWVDLATAIKKLELAREKQILRDSKAIYKEWEKTKKHIMEEEEENFQAVV